MPRPFFSADMDIDPDGRLDELLKLAEGFSFEVLELADATFRDLQPAHLSEIRQIPPRRSYPQDYPGGQLPFDTRKQQRAYWATNGFGAGIPFRRTGTMIAAVAETIVRTPRKVEVIASYGKKSTIYVLGPIRSDEKSQMQRFHRVTGWKPAAEKFDRHAEQYYERFVRRFESWIAFYRR